MNFSFSEDQLLLRNSVRAALDEQCTPAHVRAMAALLSPDSGILEAESLARTLARLCTERDAFVLTGTPLVDAAPGDQGVELRTPAETIVSVKPRFARKSAR